MRKFIPFFLFLLVYTLPINANDGRFFTNGNQLVPMLETDIQLKKEVLTITLTDNGWADIDVKYTLFVPEREKEICVGFEAPCPQGAVTNEYQANGKHPYITDFSVSINNAPIPYKHAVTPHWKQEKNLLIQPIDTSAWHTNDEYTGVLYNARLDSTMEYSYTYYFNARFEKGFNTLHHHYRYKTNESIAYTYGLEYKLTPATRWAGGKIEDFTLIIRCPQTAKHFLVNDFEFGVGAQFQTIEGTGKTRQIRWKEGDEQLSKTEIAVRNGAVRYRAINFHPINELFITSADESGRYSYDKNGKYKDPAALPYGFFYDRGPGKSFVLQTRKASQRLKRNLPYANRGYVFKDKKLKTYFQQFWWYMPDPTYIPSQKDFTPYEKERMQEK